MDIIIYVYGSTFDVNLISFYNILINCTFQENVSCLFIKQFCHNVIENQDNFNNLNMFIDVISLAYN